MYHNDNVNFIFNYPGTPATAAGLANRIWAIEEIIKTSRLNDGIEPILLLLVYRK